VDLVHETMNRATLRSTVDPWTERDRSSPECGAHRCYRGSELDTGGPKGGGLLGDSDHEVGWRRGAHDLAGSKVIKQRKNELQRGDTWRCRGVEPGMR
jgi:hypothetical protein